MFIKVVLLLQISLAVGRRVAINLEQGRGGQGRFTQSNGYGGHLTNRENVAYTGTISASEPKQNFRVLFDTASRYTWLPVKGCMSNGKTCGPNLYNPRNSGWNTTAPFEVKYSTGPTKGFLYVDCVALGPADTARDFRLPQRPLIGGATQVANGYEAVVGLPSMDYHDNKANRNVSLFHHAYAHGMFQEPIFTVYMGTCNEKTCKKNGKITLGGFDSENCGPRSQIHWNKLTDQSPLWTFRVDSITLGMNIVQDVMYAISDTSSPIVKLPSELYNKLMRNVKATRKSGKTYVPCNTNAGITLIVNEKTYKISSANMLKKEGHQCELLVGHADRGKIILGTPFIREVCQVYDIKTRRIGFVKPAENFDEKERNRGRDEGNKRGPCNRCGRSGSSYQG